MPPTCVFETMRPKNVLCFGQFEVRLVRFITFIRYQNVSAVRGGWDTLDEKGGLPLLRHVFSIRKKKRVCV